MRIRAMRFCISMSCSLLLAGVHGVAFAHGGGGHGGGGGGGGHGGGSHGGGGHYGGRYGGRYGGWRGGYGYGGFYGGWGYGLFFASLPWYYDTYWWNGVPYYYADDVYYQWNGDAAEYQTVQPPAGLVDQVKTQTPAARELFMYPKAGQTTEQQAHDRAECHLWAVTEAGFDPTSPPNPSANPSANPLPNASANASTSSDSASKRTDYLRADRACLEGRNYSVE